MDVGRIAGGLALLGGAAALGGAGSYAAIKAAGESEGGMGGALLGMAGGSALLVGGASGLVAMQAGRFGGGNWAPGIAKLLTIPAGIAGAMAGGALARSALRSEYKDEYTASERKIDQIMETTQDALRGAGADEVVLSRVRESYDRSFFNAAYKPPRGVLGGNEIVVGRHPGTGDPLAVDDVIAHEFSHKVLHAYSPELLSRSGDGQAIHESVADTFAMLVDRDDWLVGEDAVPGGVRSFSNPEVRGSFDGVTEHPAPITREQLESSTEEHLGAGVGNKAAWRIGSALGRDTMGKIYVAALEKRELPKGATYADLARVVREAAVDLYGADSREATVVDDAWTQAGY